MKWIFRFLKPLRGRITLGITVKTIGTVAELIIPFLLSHILENVIETNKIGSIVFYGVLMAVSAAVAGFGNVIANRMASKTTMIFSTRMRKELFSKTLNLSARSTDGFTIPSLESRITSDTYNVQNFIGMIQRMGIRAPILLLGGSVITLLMDAKLALVMIAMLPVIFLVIYSVSRLGVPLYSKVQQSVDGMVRVVREDAQGIRVIKALSKVDYENARYDKANMTLRKNEAKAGTIMGVVNPVMTLLMNGGIVAVVAASAFFVANNTSSAATVIAFMQYFTLISMAMMSLSRMFVMYTKCAASAKRIEKVLTEESELKDIEDDGKGDTSLHISFENVSFSYLHKEDNIKNVSFALKKGETLGIIGATGSGKSTLLRLLMRFYDNQSGEILIDDIPSINIKRSDLRLAFNMVLQDTWLFCGTIYDNIVYGRENATPEEVYAAAKSAKIDNYIKSLPDGYNTVLSDDGVNISKGQKQLITIARAFLSKAPILILDEATSNVDSRTEIQIQNAMTALMENKTCFIIAHRLSTIQNADTILVVKDGTIIEKGNHDELIKQGGFYHSLYHSQFN